MKNNIKVSIVTPSYNQAEFIEETIRSVINQSYKNIEYIVIDGNSTDGSIDIINKYRKDIDITVVEDDKGQSDAINKGFKMATGHLIGWLNSDDILDSKCVEEIVRKFKENEEASIVFSSKVGFIDSNGTFLESKSFEIADRHYLLNKRTTVIQPGSFYNGEFLKKVDYLDQDLHYCMDLDLWLKLSALGPIVPVDGVVLSFFRTYSQNKSSTGKFNYSKERRKVLFRNGANVFSKSVLHSYYHDTKLVVKSLFKTDE